MRKYFVIASIFLLATGCAKQPVLPSAGRGGQPLIQTAPISQNQPAQNQATSTPDQTATSTTISLPVKYDNAQYGFIFFLPADWQGYSILNKTWQGTPAASEGDVNAVKVSGPLIYIRNPNWTTKNPYEDIPVAVFTPDQWDQVQAGQLDVYAAPFPPSELGRNKNYVFGLPPRYNYDFRAGFEEVEKIMQNNPLVGY